MKIIPGNWLMNAGIIGYLRICELAGIKFNISKGFLEITSSDLQQFTEAYFTTILMLNAERIFRFRPEIFREIKAKVDNKEFAQLRSKFDHLGSNSFRKMKPNYNKFNSSLTDVSKIKH